ncbi:SDR family NAD(P)-dependent oxidoreductase [Streptomyces sp. NPDC046862]|uniref:SDR family NAD(P)-dependent oxidoreductase n=1 Tax=Streptomyces sp. NPDC046862 TaxID=3154603 RepID=UPI00345233FD
MAGVWSLGDACRVVAARGRLMQALPSGGAMWAVQAAESEITEGSGVWVAAVNGPSSLVISGEEDAVRTVADRLSGEGRRVKRLAVSHAFHSGLMDPMLEDFASVLSGVTFREPVVPVVSNVTGEVAGTELCSPEYWVRHVRATVRFADAVRAVRTRGVGTVLELGPDGSLASMVQETAPDLLALGALRRDRDEADTLMGAVAQAYARGADVDWRALFDGTGARRTELPTYAFQHRAYWPETAAGPASDVLVEAGLAPADHPLLHTWLESASGGEVVATGRLSAATHPWLADHTVLGSVLVPGTAFLELACWAGQRLGCPEVSELVLHAPLVLATDTATQVQLVIGPPDDSGRRTVGAYARPAPAHGTAPGVDQPWTRHAEGLLAPASAVPVEPLPWPPSDAEPVAAEDCYARLADVGVTYGPAFLGLRSVWRSGEEAGVLYAEADLPDEVRAAAGRFCVHPALLDAALHALGVDLSAAEPARLPFSWRGVRVHAIGAEAVRVRLARSEDGTVGVTAVDGTGLPVVTVEGLVLREVTDDRSAVSGPGGATLHRVEWTALPPIADPAPVRPFAVSVPAGGGSGPVVLPDAGSPPDAVVVHLPPGTIRTVTAFTLRLLQQWAEADESFADTALVVVTRRAATVADPGLPVAAACGFDGGDVPSAHAAAAGLVRSAQVEQPGRVVLLDIEGSENTEQRKDADTVRGGDGTESTGDGEGVGSVSLTDSVLAEALAHGEPELVVRGGRLYGRRLVRVTGTAPLEMTGGMWRLDTTVPGSLTDLALVPTVPPAQELDHGQVRVAVRAAGVNFRDTMIALDMYPGEAELGTEGAGVVLETGPGVSRFAPGDRVMGLLDGAFAPVAVADHRMLAPVPEGWTLVQAAAAPVAHLTAWYGLRDLAGVRPGSRVLVHAAAGGVGTVAVRLARLLGAEVYATASEAKRGALRAAGLDDAHTADSRTTDFRERFLDATDGQGMDIVLNCLAREFTDASLELLPRGGQFVDIGKTDLRAPERVAADHPGIVYRSFDLGDPGPDRIQELLTELGELFATGELAPPPVTVWDVRRAREAFRAVAQARITGKAVLTIGPADGADGTVLVTGGTGALGAAVARHLATAHGVRRLVLTSRSGPDAPGAAELLADLRDAGVDVQVTACDVGDRNAVAALLDRLDTEGQRLSGVVHCAGVVADGVLASLTPERLDEVLHAKADGARHLHELTREHCPDLDLLVLFSSISATFGAAGQANYSAANAYLDSLAERRRAAGLPAVSIAWGLWEQSSTMTAGLGARDRERVRRTGTTALSTERALALFDAALTATSASVVAAPLDLRALRDRHRQEPVPALLRDLLGTVPRQAAALRQQSSPSADFTARLTALPAEERHGYALALVLEETAQVLGHARTADVDADQSFKDQGFDSLTAVELRNRLRAATGMNAPATLVFDHPSPVALTAHLLQWALPAAPDPEEELLRGLDRLETVAETLTAGGAAHTEVAGRLRRVLHRLDTGALAATGPADGEDTLGGATADEVLAFIDSQFGDLT